MTAYTGLRGIKVLFEAREKLIFLLTSFSRLDVSSCALATIAVFQLQVLLIQTVTCLSQLAGFALECPPLL